MLRRFVLEANQTTVEPPFHGALDCCPVAPAVRVTAAGSVAWVVNASCQRAVDADEFKRKFEPNWRSDIAHP
jgi:hypothetical protein